MVGGDVISQTIVLQDITAIDLRQTTTFAIAGLIFVGPAVRGCLVAIDKMFGPTSNIKVLSKKLFVDQILIAPVFLVCYISVLTLLKTMSFQEVMPELKKNYLNVLSMNYKFWPVVQMLNYYFVPLTYRVLFGSSASLIWNTLFSYRLYNKRKLMQKFDDFLTEEREQIERPGVKSG